MNLKNHWRLACSAMLVAASLTALAPVSAAPGISSCVKHDDDPGFGGSDVSCGLGCDKGAGLVIAAMGVDSDADVAASVNCGGVGAGCAGPSPVCAGLSMGLTSYKDAGTCSGETDEFISSMVYVACAAIAGLGTDADPEEEICRTLPPDHPLCKNVGRIVHLTQIRASCVQQFPDLVLLGPQALAGLFPSTLDGLPILEYRSFGFDADQLVSISFVYESAGWTCSMQ